MFENLLYEVVTPFDGPIGKLFPRGTILRMEMIEETMPKESAPWQDPVVRFGLYDEKKLEIMTGFSNFTKHTKLFKS